MFSVRALTISLALAGAAVASAAQAGVVVSSSGPSKAEFPTGRKIDDNAQITLREGDVVTVLTAGGTRVIKGAGVHKVGASGDSKRSTFAVLTRQRSASRVRTGAVRGTGPATAAAERSPNLWYVDVTRPGTMCFASANAVRLWRPGGNAPMTYTISGGGNSVTVTFAQNTRDVAWDLAALPLSNGVRYSIAAPDRGSTNEVDFVMLEAVPDEPEGLAMRLIEKGCMNQLELLAAAMS